MLWIWSLMHCWPGFVCGKKLVITWSGFENTPHLLNGHSNWDRSQSTAVVLTSIVEVDSDQLGVTLTNGRLQQQLQNAPRSRLSVIIWWPQCFAGQNGGVETDVALLSATEDHQQAGGLAVTHEECGQPVFLKQN